MIPALKAASLSFKANERVCARDAYSALLDRNFKTAQKQNDIAVGAANQQNPQISMHGSQQGQKLDVTA